MKTRGILAEGKPTLSSEVFPPKTKGAYDSVERTAAEVARLKPSLMGVTYGTGGGASEYAVGIASVIKKECGVTPLAHLTCISSTREKVHRVLGELRECGIENVLALRGDAPRDDSTPKKYHYASELIREIKKADDFCVGTTCHPENHVESANKSMDIDHLRQKVEAGCDSVTTQILFDNNIPYNYLYRVHEKGIQMPVVAGIMPVTNAKQTRRTIQMSGVYLLFRFVSTVNQFGDSPAAMKQAGIAYATDQITDLIVNGVNGIHVYSMNKLDVTMKIKENPSEALQG